MFDPPEDNPVQRFSRSVVPSTGKKVKDQVFAFDRVYDENANQADVYEGTTKQLLDSVLDGYNATVFAYGATGCGKTHTITGTAQMPGIIFLTMQELFEKIHERSDDKEAEVSLSYLEIYNETIRDLLVPGGSKQGLVLREDSQQAVTVTGLTSHHPRDVQEVMDMIVQGNEYRTVSPTAANATSSRSHAVLQINVAQKDRSSAVSEPHTMATLSIIDLAGSERATATLNRGARLKEGANINKSLLALGSCINALCDPKKYRHVPYRDSKLTRLLKFSLGGNCKTVMIVCVSPSSAHFDETQNTLRYANRAKNIQTKVTRNVFNVNRHVKDFLVKIDEQLAIINQLKMQQKEAGKTFFAKFQKELEKKDGIYREGISRLRSTYEKSAAERQEKVNMMKQLKTFERRIRLLSAWMGAFDAVCDNRDGEENMPGPLTTVRKTALGLLSEFENSRQYLHRKIENSKWDRALNSTLSNSIAQLPEDARQDGPEVCNLQREADLLRERFESAALREIMEHEKSADAVMVQALLTAHFETLASLSETLEMNEDEAVQHAKEIINRLLESGYAATSNVVKPNGNMMPLERFAPTKRGTPKRRRASLIYKENAKPIPAVATTFTVNPSIAGLQEEAGVSPTIKASPRRRKVNSPRISVSFTPVRKSKGSKRSVRWRDDDGEEGTLADYAKTPTKLDFSPAAKPSSFSPHKAAVMPSPVPVPTHMGIIEESANDSSTVSLEIPEAVSLAATKPNRFKAGFLSKASRQSNESPPLPHVPASVSLNSSSSDSESPRQQHHHHHHYHNSRLRSIDPANSSISNLLPPVRTTRIPSPKPPSSPSSAPLSSTADENQPPSASGSDTETAAVLNHRKIRNAIAAKRCHRVSSIGSMTSSSISPASGAAFGDKRSRTGRVSSTGSSNNSVGGSSSLAGGGARSSLASSTNGINRNNRRGSAERRRSPPISCSPPSDIYSRSVGGLTPGQARRMNLGGSVRGVGGSPDFGGRGSAGPSAGAGLGNEGSGARRVTIPAGGMNGVGPRRAGGAGLVWR